MSGTGSVAQAFALAEVCQDVVGKMPLRFHGPHSLSSSCLTYSRETVPSDVVVFANPPLLSSCAVCAHFHGGYVFGGPL
jgi:hypothetical protein